MRIGIWLLVVLLCFYASEGGRSQSNPRVDRFITNNGSANPSANEDMSTVPVPWDTVTAMPLESSDSNDALSINSDVTDREDQRPTTLWISDSTPFVHFELDEIMDDRGAVWPAQAGIAQPALRPNLPLQQSTSPPPGSTAARPTAELARLASLRFGQRSSLLSASRRPRATGPSYDIVYSMDATLRATTDSGNLLRKSPVVTGIDTNQRTPIVTETRIHGERPGQSAASGSYWVPARMDLDTTLSKIDSRIIQDMIVIKGPYSALHGPGFSFIDVELIPSPRYGTQFETHGSTTADYKTNGDQWYGHQAIWGGDQDWGYRIGYGHRTGNDFQSGNDIDIPASYNSRDWDVALGADLTDDQSIEFHYLRLDQTDVEYPGQAFDMDFLVTDGFEVEYTLQDQPLYDLLSVESWYNRTRFAGNAQSDAKRRQFPFLEFLRFEGATDVDSMSTGFRTAASWGDNETSQLTAGSDLRYVKQELNEITSGRFFANVWDNANSPIPKSHSSNPGLFVQYVNSEIARVSLTGGSRIDWVSTNIDDDPSKLAEVGTYNPPLHYADIVGSADFDRDFTLFSSFATIEFEMNNCLTALAGGGYAERAPTLTELYAAGPFMFLLQNGLNTVTGDPELDKERMWQFDLGLRFENGKVRIGLNGYHAWVHDYITFENMDTVLGPPLGQIEQANLKFVNTDLATLSGFDFFAEFDLNKRLACFGTVSYVEGRDRSRNGEFATRQAGPGPTTQSPGLPRGSYSGIVGASREPLPSMRPMESRLGLRLHEPSERPRWSTELSLRVVDGQDRIATSLLETTTSGFTTWDVRGFWQARESLLLIAGVENFGDRTYREYLDFRSSAANRFTVLQPGANFYFGTELSY